MNLRDGVIDEELTAKLRAALSPRAIQQAEEEAFLADFREKYVPEPQRPATDEGVWQALKDVGNHQAGRKTVLSLDVAASRRRPLDTAMGEWIRGNADANKVVPPQGEGAPTYQRVNLTRELQEAERLVRLKSRREAGGPDSYGAKQAIRHRDRLAAQLDAAGGPVDWETVRERQRQGTRGY